MTRPLYRLVAETLADHGVDLAFGLPGEDTAALCACLAEHGIAYRAARHEAGAVAMADGYSWASGRLGVAVASRGPGLMNALVAVRTAAVAGRRVLVISGDEPRGDDPAPLKRLDTGTFASLAGAGLVEVPSAGRGAARRVAEALASARAGTATLLTVAADAAGAPTGERSERASPPLRRPHRTTPAELARLAELLSSSRRPLLLAGRGASDRCARQLVALAERTGAYLGTTLPCKGRFAGHPHDLGVVGGYASDPGEAALRTVDLAIAFGASLGSYTLASGRLLANATWIRVDDGGSPTDPRVRTVPADAESVADGLLDRVRDDGGPAAPPPVRPPWYRGGDASGEAGMDPRVLAGALGEALPDDSAVVVDGGRCMTAAARYLPTARTGLFRIAAEAGAIGLGLGIALGAAHGAEARPTVLVAGDGALAMGLAELETVARQRVPLGVVAFDDRAYGSELALLRRDGLDSRCVRFDGPRVEAVAGALGIEAVGVRRPERIGAFVEALVERRAPLVADCPIDPDVEPALALAGAVEQSPEGKALGTVANTHP